MNPTLLLMEICTEYIIIFFKNKYCIFVIFIIARSKLIRVQLTSSLMRRVNVKKHIQDGSWKYEKRFVCNYAIGRKASIKR